MSEKMLPKGWKWSKCQEVIDVRDGTHDTPKYTASGIPLITSKNLKSDGIDFHNIQYISVEDHEKICRRSKVDNGDILYSMIGTIGNPVIVETNYEFSIKNVALFKLHNNKEVHPSFFRYLLLSDIVLRQLKNESRGGIQEFVSLNVLRNLQIPTPPFDEQKRIAAILDKAEAVRRKRQESIRLLDEFLRSVFLEMFGDPVRNEKGWEVASLSALAEIVSGVTKGRDLSGKDVVSVPYMRVANVQDGHIDLSDIKMINVLPSDTKKYKLQSGDILLTEGGDPDKLGRGAVWYDQIPNCIHQNHIFRVRVQREKLNPEYVSRLVGSSYGKRYFLKSAKQTTGIATINSQQLKGFPILIPPVELQDRFAQILERAEQQKHSLEKNLNEMENGFNSMMQKAFRGGI
jgi:type I restriction enzyme S subunit